MKAHSRLISSGRGRSENNRGIACNPLCEGRDEWPLLQSSESMLRFMIF